MSTPKPNAASKIPWDNHNISPITVSNAYSDTDQSSNEEFQSARSNVSRPALDGGLKPAKSLGYIASKTEAKGSALRGANPIAKNLHSVASAFRSSYSNLNGIGSGATTMQGGGKFRSGPQVNLLLRGSGGGDRRGSQSNLKTVGTTLRGSYTSLRPLSSVNLPVAPPINNRNADSTIVISRPASGKQNHNSHPNMARTLSTGTKIAEVSLSKIE